MIIICSGWIHRVHFNMVVCCCWLLSFPDPTLCEGKGSGAVCLPGLGQVLGARANTVVLKQSSDMIGH